LALRNNGCGETRSQDLWPVASFLVDEEPQYAGLTEHRSYNKPNGGGVMSNAISITFDSMVPHGKLVRCIASLEDGMRSLKRTPYHRVLGKDFLGQTNDLAEWLIAFHQLAVESKVKLAAIYLEMNGFAINPKQWYCDFFGYKKAGEIWDLDWLSAWDAESQEGFALQGMESVQKAFAELFSDGKQPLGVKLAEEIAEHLVTARFMELVAAAHKVAKRRYSGVKGLPILATAHGWDTVHMTK
jgi:hypothetical protein